MTQYVFEPQAPVTVPVVGSDKQFPVRRVYCVGRNYAAHAREMGFDPDREPPFFFCKPADAVIRSPLAKRWRCHIRRRPITIITKLNW
ncbi:fumarylacetoacetate hydrolase family protein [Escherichia coli]|uniref:fumarylacetoacetate hydrolase family protein n=1 Tax=Escherichia coli TaxID=562 RepID=UPI00398020B8